MKSQKGTETLNVVGLYKIKIRKAQLFELD